MLVTFGVVVTEDCCDVLAIIVVTIFQLYAYCCVLKSFWARGRGILVRPLPLYVSLLSPSTNEQTCLTIYTYTHTHTHSQTQILTHTHQVIIK